LLIQTFRNKQEGEMNSIFVQQKLTVPGLQKGFVIYRRTCSVCHGADGEGIQYLAPPLNGSEYVAGPTDRLGMIILNGLKGPIHVKGQLYNFNGTMPNFGNDFSDEEIAGIIDYLHNSFVAASPALSYGLKRVKPEEIKNIRSKKTGILTEKDLLKMADPKNK
jgi:mono/diheme cytochrome c family protein